MRQTVSKEIKNNLGYKCANCGSEENIEYHHIVPVLLGGGDIQSNIVPLCHRCHKAAHHGRHISEFAEKSNSGRKSFATEEEHSEIFDMFINGEIGNKKCNELLGYSKRTTIKDRPAFKRYIKSKGITRVHNFVDVAFSNKKTISNGYEVGEIEYADGRVEPITYKDTGMNDIDYKKRDYSERKKKELVELRMAQVRKII